MHIYSQTSTMTFLATILIALICSIVLTLPTQAEVDCKKKIKDRKLKDCCRIPEPNFNDFYSTCPKGVILGHCGYDCLFRSTKTLENDKLNMVNLRATLNKMFNNTILYVDAYALAYEKCEPIVLEKLEGFKKLGKRFPGAGLCSPLPMGLKICAHKYMFASCPANAWTASAECEEMKEYIKVCSGRIGKKNGDKIKKAPRTQTTGQNPELSAQSSQTSDLEKRSTDGTNTSKSKGQRGNGRKGSQTANGQKGTTSDPSGSTAEQKEPQTTGGRRGTTSKRNGSTQTTGRQRRTTAAPNGVKGSTTNGNAITATPIG